MAALTYSTSVPAEQVLLTALQKRVWQIFDQKVKDGCTFPECLAAIYSVGLQAGAEVARDVTRTVIVNLERGAPEDVPAIIAWAKEQTPPPPKAWGDISETKSAYQTPLSASDRGKWPN